MCANINGVWNSPARISNTHKHTHTISEELLNTICLNDCHNFHLQAFSKRTIKKNHINVVHRVQSHPGLKSTELASLASSQPQHTADPPLFGVSYDLCYDANANMYLESVAITDTPCKQTLDILKGWFVTLRLHQH